jgi:hypothetical protein
MRNAFFCGSHSTMDENINRHARTIDRPLLRDRHREAVLTLEHEDETVDFAVGSGAPPGDSNAADCFGDVFYPLLDDWLEDTPEVSVWASMPFEDGEIDVGCTDYADDIARKVLLDSVGELHRKLRALDIILDNHLESEGYQQNSSKKEMVPHVVGTGRNRTEEYLYKIAPARFGCQVRPSARYLGTQLHRNLSARTEIQERITATHRAYYSFGKFWMVGPRRLAVLIFRSVVIGSALAGLIAVVLTEAETSRLDRAVVRLARKIMLGKAARAGSDPTKFASLPNTAVWRYIGCAPMAVELRIRRLTFWTTVARTPERYKQLLAAVFGALTNIDPAPLDSEGRITPNAHRWARQFHDDMESLRDFDDLAYIPEAADGRLLAYFVEGEPRTLLLEAEFTAFRRRELSVHIPPPGAKKPAPEEGQVLTPAGLIDCADLPFLCLCTCEDGSECKAQFETQHMLSVHVRLTKGGTHGFPRLAQLFAFCNMCPICRVLLASTISCRHHLTRSLERGFCRSVGASHSNLLCPPRTLCCPVCKHTDQFDDIEALCDHVRLHLPAAIGPNPDDDTIDL